MIQIYMTVLFQLQYTGFKRMIQKSLKQLLKLLALLFIQNLSNFPLYKRIVASFHEQGNDTITDMKFIPLY